MYEQKLEYLIEVGRKIRAALAARKITGDGEMRPLKSDVPYDVSLEGKMTWLDKTKAFKEKKERGTFSTTLSHLEDRNFDLGTMLQEMDICSPPKPSQAQSKIDPEYEARLKKIGIDPSKIPPCNKPKFHLIGDRAILRDGYEFSDDPLEFGGELYKLILVFASAKGEDQQVDFIAMKALFHAGKVLGHLEAQGRQKSDKQGERSRNQKKGRYSDDDIVNAFNECHAKNPNDMWVEIDKFLDNDKKRTGDKRTIPSRSTILRTLKEMGLEEQLPK